jgi:hypothetical protein
MNENEAKQRDPVLVKRINFAKMAGVVPATITKAVQKGELVDGPGGLLDINLLVNAQYIREHRARPPFDRPVAEIKADDALLDPSAYVKLIFCIKKGKNYIPIMGMDFEPGKDTATREIYFHSEEDSPLEIFFKDDGSPWRFKIGEKFHKAHLAFVNA